MNRLALLSFHTCPAAQLGTKNAGGMNVYVRQVAQEFGTRGYQVDVFTRTHSTKEPKIITLGPNARLIHIAGGPFSTSKDELYFHTAEFISNLYEYVSLENISYDIIHSHYWLSGYIGLILNRRWQVPHITTFHTLGKIKLSARAGENESVERISTEKKIVDEVQGIIVATDQEKKDLIKLYDIRGEKIRAIPPGVNLSTFQPIPQEKARRRLGLNDEKIILYVGRVEPLKGLRLLIRTLTYMDNTPNLKLLIVGGDLNRDQEISNLELLATKLNVDNIVKFIGPVEHQNLPVYYSAADAFALPSYYESFGLVALEAMACQTPVVASRVGGLKTIVKSGETGYLISRRCPEAFAHRLEMLLSNFYLRHSMGIAARSAAQDMSWKRLAKETLSYYTCFIKNGNSEHS